MLKHLEFTESFALCMSYATMCSLSLATNSIMHKSLFLLISVV